MKATTIFSIQKWDENTYLQISETMKMTKASVIFDGKGDLEGKASVEYLMMYTQADAQDPEKSTCTYVGLTWFEGTLQGKRGSFALEESGVFKAGRASSTLKIIAGSGTSELKGIAGTGELKAVHGSVSFELEYSF